MRKQESESQKAQKGRKKMNFNIKNIIINALISLGYSTSNVEITPVAFHRFSVKAGGVLVGIYDLDRHTFVD